MNHKAYLDYLGRIGGGRGVQGLAGCLQSQPWLFVLLLVVVLVIGSLPRFDYDYEDDDEDEDQDDWQPGLHTQPLGGGSA